ncbi:hypothetical protein JCM6882_003776 [Rhodosporidiobolus microsporus]
MVEAADKSEWHSISLSIPFPSAANATLVKRVIEVDRVLKPSELTRTLTVEGASLVIDLRARTVSQARVALDHLLSDIQLVVQTMYKFGPADVVGEKGAGEVLPEAPSLEVGLMGSWEAVRR